MRVRTLARAAAVVAVGALVAGCGGGVESGPQPVRIMTIASFESQSYSLPWLRTAIQIGVDALNRAGGVDGRPVEVSFCNDEFNPNGAVACAQRAVDDEVVAVVGGLTPNVGALAPVLEAAGVPFIGPGGADSVAEATSPISYPINGGSVAFTMAAGRLAVQRGGPNVVVVPMDNPANLRGGEWLAEGVRRAGGTARTVVAPLTAPDYSATAASILSSAPDAVGLSASDATAARIVTALRQGGFTGTITGPASIVNAASLKELGAAADGIVLASRGLPSSDTSNSLVAEYNTEMKAADPQIRIDDIGLNGWLSVKVFGAALQGRTVEGPESVVAALNSLASPIDLGGVYPSYPGPSDQPQVPEYPRIAVFEVMENTVRGGVVTPSGEFFNPLAS